MLSFKIELPRVNHFCAVWITYKDISGRHTVYFSKVSESSISVLNELNLTRPRGLPRKCTQGKQTISHTTSPSTQGIAETHSLVPAYLLRCLRQGHYDCGNSFLQFGIQKITGIVSTLYKIQIQQAKCFIYEPYFIFTSSEQNLQKQYN